MDDFIGWHGLTADGEVTLEKVGDCYRPTERKAGFLPRGYSIVTAS